MSLRGVTVLALGAAAVVMASKKGRKRVKRAVDVYLDEVSSGAKPIEGVGTAIAAFVGFAERGPIDTP